MTWYAASIRDLQDRARELEDGGVAFLRRDHDHAIADLAVRVAALEAALVDTDPPPPAVDFPLGQRDHQIADDLLRQCRDEMLVRQDRKWGWPRPVEFLDDDIDTTQYGLSLSERLRGLESRARKVFAEKRPCWQAIVAEEIGEAYRETDPRLRIKELVESAAVCLSHAQAIQEQQVAKEEPHLSSWCKTHIQGPSGETRVFRGWAPEGEDMYRLWTEGRFGCDCQRSAAWRLFLVDHATPCNVGANEYRLLRLELPNGDIISDEDLLNDTEGRNK